ncbi:MAG: hypothetical protein ABIL23_07555, partial [candidate division WOR-3 bacterium]
ESFRWEKKVSLTEISESIKKNFGVDVGRIKSLEVLMRSETGRVKEVKVVGSKNSFVVRGDWNIRVALGNLKSSYFTFKRKGNYIYFYGGGWGHGIGMCQVGAGVRALKGWNYEEILKFYYGNVELVKVW